MKKQRGIAHQLQTASEAQTSANGDLLTAHHTADDYFQSKTGRKPRLPFKTQDNNVMLNGISGKTADEQIKLQYVPAELSLSKEEKEQIADQTSAAMSQRGEISEVLQSGRAFRYEQAIQLGLTETEIEQRERLEETVVRLNLPESLDAAVLNTALAEIQAIRKELNRWKKAHRQDPLLSELNSILDSRVRLIELYLDP